MTLFPELTVFLLAAFAALLVGLGKTGVPALSLAYNAIMVIAIPSKESIGLVLLLLIIGDCFALFFYRKHAQWGILLKLLPSILVGVLMGTFLLAKIPNDAIKPIIGIAIFTIFSLDIAQNRGLINFDRNRPILAVFFGSFAGVATVIGNAAGPILAVYFLLLKFDKKQFMGTSAWLFFIVNLTKVPLLLSIDVVTIKTFSSVTLLLPFIIVGAIGGKFVLKYIPLNWFSSMVTWSALGSSAYFILEYIIVKGWFF